MDPVIALIAAIVFFVLVVSPHFIKPATHMISEYAIGRLGWIMQLAFYCLAISCFMVALSAFSQTSHVGAIILIIAGVGAVGAGFFITDPVEVAMQKHSKTSILHLIFSFILIPLFPIAATTISLSLGNSSLAENSRQLLFWLSVLAWVGFVGFIGLPALLSSTVRDKHTPNLSGYFQRFMVLTYVAWLIAVSIVLWR